MSMRPLMSLLLLAVLLLVNGADGIRLLEDEYSTAGLLTKVEEKRSSLMEEGFTAGKGCGSHSDHCSGKNRKLVKNAMGAQEVKRSNKMGLVGELGGRYNAKEDVGRSQEDFQVESPATANPQLPTYPDVLDIAGMDYSPAKRKPPIHN